MDILLLRLSHCMPVMSYISFNPYFNGYTTFTFNPYSKDEKKAVMVSILILMDILLLRQQLNNYNARVKVSILILMDILLLLCQ